MECKDKFKEYFDLNKKITLKYQNLNENSCSANAQIKIKNNALTVKARLCNFEYYDLIARQLLT